MRIRKTKNFDQFILIGENTILPIIFGNFMIFVKHIILVKVNNINIYDIDDIGEID